MPFWVTITVLLFIDRNRHYKVVSSMLLDSLPVPLELCGDNKTRGDSVYHLMIEYTIRLCNAIDIWHLMNQQDS